MTQQKNHIKCDICKKKFTTMSILKNHKRTVHENKRSFNCNLCDKIVKEKGTLMPQVFNIPKVEHDQPCSTLVVIVFPNQFVYLL